ncbi:nucleoside 2-deoxyribosyltransferase [Paenibacillus sp. PR3]|uniref:Nucleoside 2-deoxyribosyltransferase n=1 Tax=Paenibacillus terricola TaxID=2763503 RepID=A0ABR8N490_9BACL|nr:nucleoside 2-deoxyribosyltransferase [Paenibacillus terricola]MBD3922983.1 nucleoside 2-deoxyribosyltransferase [Paenibacillus terricola]
MGKLLVYMAGKIGKNDWRHRIFKDLRNANNGFVMKMVDGFQYCGPYFIKCDHGCYHGDNTHGRGLNTSICESGIDEYNGYEASKQNSYNVVTKCTNWIQAASVVFAWIDRPDAYGTIAEIGYAVALGKPVFVAVSNELACVNDLWFPCRLADVSINSNSAEEAWSIFITVFDKKTRTLNKLLIPKEDTSSQPATEKQKKYLSNLMKNAGYILKSDLDDLTIGQAGLYIAFFVDDKQLSEELSSLLEYDI